MSKIVLTLILIGALSVAACGRRLHLLFRKKWHVMIMPPYEHGRGVTIYLGRYVKGGPISNRRIVGYNGAEVTFRYKDNGATTAGSQPGKKTLTLSAPEFIERVSQHVPPAYMHAARYYGIFSYGKRALLTHACELLGRLRPEEPDDLTWQNVCARAGGQHPERCPVCGKMLIIYRCFTRDAILSFSHCGGP